MNNLQKRLHRNFPTAFPALIILCSTIFTQQTNTKPQIDAPVFRICWLYQTNESEITKLASDNESGFYFSLSSGKLLSLNLETVEKLWETNLGGNIVSDILVDRNNIYIAQKLDESASEKAASEKANSQIISIQKSTKETLILYSLDKVTGITGWQFKIAESDKVYLYDTGDSLTIFLNNGMAYSLAKTDGKLLWTRNLGSNLSARPLEKNSEIILGTADKQVVYLSLKDGRTLRKFEIKEQSAVIAEDTDGNNLIVGDRKGSVWSLNKKKQKRRWTLRQGAEISNLLYTAQGLLMSSFDNFVYLVAETSGKLIWKKRLPGRIAAEPQIKDNHIIINSIDESAAFVLELNTGKLINKITLEDDNFFTGESMQLNNLLIYATLRGIVSFSASGEGCRQQKNRS